jgi:RNA-directed DNA polymerase
VQLHPQKTRIVHVRHGFEFLGYKIKPYFRLTEVKGVLEDLDGWIRRKLRSVLWRQWKRTYTRAKNLMRAGIDEVRAWRSATNQRGPWWNGGASHMNAAYPKSWFDRMGLVSLLEARQRLTSAS